MVDRVSRKRPTLVLALGQSAYEAVRGLTSAPLLHAMTYHDQDNEHHGLSCTAPLQTVMQAFRAARPGIRRIAVLLGVHTARELSARLVHLSREQNIHFQRLNANTPKDAMSQLRRLSRTVEGLWLPVDLSILTPQVSHYAVGLQFRRRIPLMGATQRHASKRALFAVDYTPSDLGRQAAVAANQLLSGRIKRARLRRVSQLANMRPRVTLNLVTAQRLKLDTVALRALATEMLK
jgi:ABC-type uncharacterized transport system substrate-binding protein